MVGVGNRADAANPTWLAAVTITGYYVYATGDGFLTTSANINPFACTNGSHYLIVDTAATNFATLYAAIMAAQGSGSTVSLHYNGCLNNYPLIDSVAVPQSWEMPLDSSLKTRSPARGPPGS